jgi:hypothetical protein
VQTFRTPDPQIAHTLIAAALHLGDLLGVVVRNMNYTNMATKGCLEVMSCNLTRRCVCVCVEFRLPHRRPLVPISAAPGAEQRVPTFQPPLDLLHVPVRSLSTTPTMIPPVFVTGRATFRKQTCVFELCPKALLTSARRATCLAY